MSHYAKVESGIVIKVIKADADFFKTVISLTDVKNISDKSLIKKIIANKWNQINLHLEDIYWENFNKKSQE